MKSRTDGRQHLLCNYCPTLCESRCPPGFTSGNIAWSPWGKMSVVHRVERGELEATPEVVRSTQMCLDCLACREACDHLVDVPANLSAFRSGQSDKGGAVADTGETTYDIEAAWRLLEKCAPSWRRSEDCQALLVPGMEMLRPEHEPVLKAVFEVLDRIGDQTVGINRDSVLECGHVHYAMGRLAAAEEEVRGSFRRFGRYTKVILASPHCLSFVSKGWAELGLSRHRQVQSLIEFVARRIDFEQTGNCPLKLAYHDPCHLGRHMNLYEMPRDMLAWICDKPPVELVHHHASSGCCGGGYPLVAASPDTARKVALTVLEEFRISGADILVTACGQCLHHLKQAAPDAPVAHIMEIIASREAPR